MAALRPIGAFFLYLVLAATCTWPLVEHSGSRIANDLGDPVLNASILWWNATTVPFSAAWWNAPHYYPSLGVSAFTENLAGISAIATPIFWLTRNPIATYNLAFLLSWPLSALAAYLLVLFVSRRNDAAFLAGLAFGFTPYRTTELAHIQMLSAYWMPMFLLGLHGFLVERRARWLWLFGAAWLLASLTNGHFMLFGAVLIGLWLAYFCSTRQTWRAGAWIVGVWGMASLPLVPVMYRYSVVHAQFGLIRSINEVLAFSARPRSWFEVSGDVWLWRSVLPDGKDDLFPGVTAVGLVLLSVALFTFRRRVKADGRTPWFSALRLALAVVTALSSVAIVTALAVGPWSVTVGGVLVRMTNLNRALALVFLCGAPLALTAPRIREALERRSPFAFYTGATLVIALLCCGPNLRVADAAILSPAPYRWLMALPGFSELRVPARFWMLGTMCLAIAAGLGFLRVRPSGPRSGQGAFALAVAGLLLDGWMPGIRTPAAPQQWSTVQPSDRPEPILELPIGPDWDWDATFRAVGHRRRVVNGVSGYNPPHYVALVAGLGSGDPAMLTALATLGAFDVVVNRAADSAGAMTRYVTSAPGVTQVGDDGHRAVYRIPQAPPEPPLGAILPVASGDAIRHGEQMPLVFDGRIDTGWGDYPQLPDEWIMLDLGGVHEVGGLTQALGDYILDFPRRLAIELSPEGAVWERVWEGSTAAHAFLAFVREPRRGAMQFSFPARPARFVKLRQLESYSSMWRISEVQVHAPIPP